MYSMLCILYILSTVHIQYTVHKFKKNPITWHTALVVSRQECHGNIPKHLDTSVDSVFLLPSHLEA